MKKSLSTFMIFVFLFSLSLSATEIESLQPVNIDGTEKKDPDKQKKEKPKKEKDAVRTGWTFGILPSVGLTPISGSNLALCLTFTILGTGLNILTIYILCI